MHRMNNFGGGGGYSALYQKLKYWILCKVKSEWIYEIQEIII